MCERKKFLFQLVSLDIVVSFVYTILTRACGFILIVANFLQFSAVKTRDTGVIEVAVLTTMECLKGHTFLA